MFTQGRELLFKNIIETTFPGAKNISFKCSPAMNTAKFSIYTVYPPGSGAGSLNVEVLWLVGGTYFLTLTYSVRSPTRLDSENLIMQTAIVSNNLEKLPLSGDMAVIIEQNTAGTPYTEALLAAWDSLLTAREPFREYMRRLFTAEKEIAFDFEGGISRATVEKELVIEYNVQHGIYSVKLPVQRGTLCGTSSNLLEAVETSSSYIDIFIDALHKYKSSLNELRAAITLADMEKSS